MQQTKSTPLRDLVPQHAYNQELESGENPFRRFAPLGDDDWLAMLERP